MNSLENPRNFSKFVELGGYCEISIDILAVVDRDVVVYYFGVSDNSIESTRYADTKYVENCQFLEHHKNV